MVPLYITPVGNRLNAARDANDAYWRLARVGFLSVRALFQIGVRHIGTAEKKFKKFVVGRDARRLRQIKPLCDREVGLIASASSTCSLQPGR